MNSEVRSINGLPTLLVNGKPIPEMAYITYRLEHNCYDDFALSGVRLYSVNLNFSEMPINERAPVLVFQKGIFEKNEPDFGIVDKNFAQILEAAPDAYIFPRINVNLPESWEKSHPDELCDTGCGERRRVSFASDLWAQEVKKNLKELIEYIEKGPYADNVIGYQIAGGNTEEWLPFDDYCFYGKRAKEKFAEFSKNRNIVPDEESYYAFASDVVAERIIEFAGLAKEVVDGKKIIGAFYGYTLGCTAKNICHHSLDKILECDKIDFMCSPIIYVHGREPGLDPYPMVPVDSLRLHNKLYFSENDVRTHLSEAIHEHPNYTSKIWFGPKEKELCLGQLKASFCRAFVHGYGMWWFDMWGGWYKDSEYMELISKMSEICRGGMDKPVSKLAVFIDEKCYSKLDGETKIVNSAVNMLGLTGASYDIYLASDFDIITDEYKAYIFIEPCKTQLMTECIHKAAACGKPFKVFSEVDANDVWEYMQEFLESSGIAVSSRKAAVYSGEKYMCLYAGETGEYAFDIDGKIAFEDLFTGEEIVFPKMVKKGECYLFKKI